MKQARAMAIGILLLSVILLAACAGRVAPTRPDMLTRGWEFLGKRQVEFALDSDAIQVTASEGAFRRVMFVVRDSAMEMFDINIIFGNGENYSPDTRLLFKEDTRSRTLDLPGSARVIKRVKFYYKSIGPSTGKATVELWGK